MTGLHAYEDHRCPPVPWLKRFTVTPGRVVITRQVDGQTVTVAEAPLCWAFRFGLTGPAFFAHVVDIVTHHQGDHTMSADKPATKLIVLDFVIEADEEEQLPTQKALQELLASTLDGDIDDDYRIINIGAPPDDPPQPAADDADRLRRAQPDPKKPPAPSVRTDKRPSWADDPLAAQRPPVAPRDRAANPAGA